MEDNDGNLLTPNVQIVNRWQQHLDEALRVKEEEPMLNIIGSGNVSMMKFVNINLYDILNVIFIS